MIIVKTVNYNKDIVLIEINKKNHFHSWIPVRLLNQYSTLFCFFLSILKVKMIDHPIEYIYFYDNYTKEKK